MAKNLEKMRKDVIEGLDLFDNAYTLIRKSIDLLFSMPPEMMQFYAKV